MRGHIRKRGKTWTIVFDEGRKDDGRRKQTWRGGFRTRADAEEELGKALHGLRTGTYVPDHRETISEYLQRWLSSAEANVRDTTLESYERNIRLHIVPRIGHIHIQRLRPTDLNKLYAHLKKTPNPRSGEPLKARSIVYIATILGKALEDAARWGTVSRNVAKGAEPPRKKARDEKPEIRTWDEHQARVFLEAAASHRLFPAFLLTATTGMRRGEVLGLRWRSLNLDSGSVTVREAMAVNRGKAVMSQPKTPEGRRMIPLDNRTVRVLRDHRRAHLEAALALGRRVSDRDFVFAWPDGRLQHPHGAYKALVELTERLGLPRIAFHGLRHTWASLALQAGVDMKVVSERLGHTNYGFTADQYTHVKRKQQDDAAQRVANLLLGEADTGTSP